MNTGRESQTASTAQIYNRLKPPAKATEDVVRSLQAIDRIRGNPTIMQSLQEEVISNGRKR